MSPLHHACTRRHWIRILGGAGLYSLAARHGLAAETAAVRHVVLPLGSAPDMRPPEELKTGFLRFGWESFVVSGEDGPATILSGLGEAAPMVPDTAVCRMRLTNALDVRDEYLLEAATPDGQAAVRFEIRFAALYQVQEIPVTPAQARLMLAQGVRLRMLSGKPMWFFAPSPGAEPAPDPVLLPHLLIAEPDADVSAQFEQRLRGLVMLQGFGWQSGCVSEGLLDLAEKRKDDELLAAVDRYLGMYFTESGVQFESPRSKRVKDAVGGIEEPLPWATLARRQPDHPALEIARKFLSSDKIGKHDVSRGQTLTTEGNYTAAYPTAVLARVLNDEKLAGIALRHLEARRLTNVHEGDIYQRANMGGDKRLKNWCRGVCWYYNGLVRTLQALEDERAAKSWLPEIRRVADLLCHHQREDGLWGNFVHDPASVADTSGSAGLAAALARAHAAGWLPEEARQTAQRALTRLQKHLTPDGLLGGAAQSNKGGDSLQQGDYRVLYQMGMGLKAQLMAAL